MTRLTSTFSAFAAAAALGASALAQSPGDVVLQVENLEFEALNPAISMAPVYGDRATGPHGTIGTFVPIFVTPFHTHSGAYHGVVISGLMTNPFEGEENPPVMGPGSYWHVPANSVHATACVSATPCVFYFHAESGFDFTPVEE